VINHRVANKIETARELRVYFLENLEVGDTVIALSPGFEYRIIAIHTIQKRVFYWARHEDEIPLTLSVGDMDSNHKVVAFCSSRSEYVDCYHEGCEGGAIKLYELNNEKNT